MGKIIRVTTAPAERQEWLIADLEPSVAYATTTTCLIPRPIAWVSTVAPDGRDNVAPHSFNTVAGIDPLTLCFVSVGVKDTLRNVRATGEFVVNIGGEAQTALINDSGTALAGEHSEFDAAGIAREPSTTVRPPRVAGAPVCFECRVSGEHSIGDCHMVFGEVQLIAVERSVLADDGRPDPRLVAPVTRLGRNQWARLGEVFALDRIRPEDWHAGRRTEPPAFGA
jgi:flavin reductase (DIM6/NTAB) family NADH-FMN oxidoreductase RutF